MGRSRANAAARVIDPVADVQVFRSGLSQGVGGPITHYWCGWWMTEVEIERFKQEVASIIVSGDLAFTNDLTLPSLASTSERKQDVLAALHLKRVPAR